VYRLVITMRMNVCKEMANGIIRERKGNVTMMNLKEFTERSLII
jgi:hypothetical protein